MTDRELLDEYEAWFRTDPDPWKFESSEYEAKKRRATLEACGPQTGRRVLELGAANGVLAAALLPLASELVAVEGVPAAAALARERLATSPVASVVEGLIPADVPAGPYDLIVASEILYYLDATAYAATLEALPRWLVPGGRLVAVHWRPAGPERPRTAGEVHRDLPEVGGLHLNAVGDTDDYRLSVLEAAAPATAEPA